MRFTKLLLFCCIFFLNLIPIHAESWNNYIINYDRKIYQGGSQNWQLLAQNNWVYVANKMGLLEFHANQWNLYKLNNKSDVRAICESTDGKELFVGGYNEFGYVKPNKIGALKYICLSDSLNIGKIDFGNIWNIEVDKAIYFIAENLIVKYQDEKLSTITCPQKIECSALIDKQLYIATNLGIYTLEGDNFHYLQHSKLLQNKKIRSIKKFNNIILIATASDGLFVLSSNNISPFITNIDPFFIKNQIFSLAINSHYIAIGTVLGGAVLLNHKAEVVKYINENKGLQNNTVLSLLFDKKGNLWLGLDSGLDYLVLNSPLTSLYSAANSYGAGYSASLFQNKLYLGTNRGLYYMNYPLTLSEYNIPLQLVEGTQGQVWDLNRIDDKLYCASDKGLFLIDNNRIIPTSVNMGTWNCKQSIKDPTKIYVSTYHGLYILDKDSPQNAQLIDGYLGSVISFEEEEPGTLWLKTGTSEVARIKLNDSLNKVVSLNNYSSKDSLPTNTRIFKLDNKVFFYDGKDCFKFDTQKKQFVIDKSINTFFRDNDIRNFTFLKQTGEQLFIVGERSLIMYNRNTKEKKIYTHSLPLINNFEQMVQLSDSLCVVPYENGFALWQANYKNTDNQKMSVSINQISLLGKEASIIYKNNFAGIKNTPETAYATNSIRIEYALNSYEQNITPLYRSRLNGGNWSEYTSADFKEFTNLSDGDYLFEVEAMLSDGTVFTDQIEFVVLPPWYLTIWGYLFFALLLTVSFFIIKYLDKVRMNKENHKMELEKQQALKEKEILFRKEHLELEIKHKSQELANIAISLVQKNESLIDLKDDIAKIIGELEGHDKLSSIKRQVLRLNNKIDQSIQQDAGFKKFQEHFDFVHDNFIQRLSDTYPLLSMHERKMCAFVKMHLSSKEIAPLLNISPRGVETLRYRVRKKLNLGRDASLTGFLDKF